MLEGSALDWYCDSSWVANLRASRPQQTPELSICRMLPQQSKRRTSERLWLSRMSSCAFNHNTCSTIGTREADSIVLCSLLSLVNLQPGALTCTVLIRIDQNLVAHTAARAYGSVLVLPAVLGSAPPGPGCRYQGHPFCCKLASCTCAS